MEEHEGIRERNHREFAVALCEALGLDPRLVRNLTLSVGVGKVPSIVVEQYVRDGSGELIHDGKEAFRKLITFKPVEGHE